MPKFSEDSYVKESIAEHFEELTSEVEEMEFDPRRGEEEDGPKGDPL
jgi:hypothetical protein